MINLTPLRQFVCDHCRDIIKSPEEGALEWISFPDHRTHVIKKHSFHIVHRYEFSGFDHTRPHGCYENEWHKEGFNKIHLDTLLRDTNGMAHILSMIDPGPYHNPEFTATDIRDLREYIEIVRRLTLPYYEQARLHWKKATEESYFEKCNEVLIYSKDNLQTLVEKYKNRMDAYWFV